MQQLKSLQVAIGGNAKVLLDQKSLHIHGRCRVAQAWQRENYNGPLITFIIRIQYSYLHYVQMES